MSARPFGIGASDAAAVLGLNRYETPVQAWLRMTGRVEPKQENDAMYFGKLLEPLIAAELEQRTGMSVMPSPTDAFHHDEHEWLFAHPDAFVVDQGVRGLGEFKTGSSRQEGAWADDVPLAYAAQAQHQMAATGAPFVVFAALLGGQMFVVKRVERDEEAIGMLIEGEARFLAYVLNDEPPPPQAADNDLMAKLYPHGGAGKVSLDHLPEIRKRYRSAKRAVKAAEAELDQVEAEIKAAMGEHELATLDGLPAFRWTSVNSHRLDGMALKQELPDVHEMYYRETHYRRLTEAKS